MNYFIIERIVLDKSSIYQNSINKKQIYLNKII